MVRLGYNRMHFNAISILHWFMQVNHCPFTNVSGLTLYLKAKWQARLCWLAFVAYVFRSLMSEIYMPVQSGELGMAVRR